MLDWRTWGFFNLHIMCSLYYFPSVVFCSCCSALGAACWLGSSRMAVWAASSCSALGAGLGWLCFPLAASLLPPRAAPTQWILLRVFLPPPRGSAPSSCSSPCLCSRKSCWKVSVFCEAELLWGSEPGVASPCWFAVEACNADHQGQLLVAFHQNK